VERRPSGSRQSPSGIERFACEVLRERGGLEADRICGINRCCWDLGGPNCSVGGASFRELWRRGRRGQEKFGGMGH